jgi:hypothetical protein
LEADEAEQRAGPEPVTTLTDPRAVQILTAEHGSLLSARSLVYTEAFTRGGMFLAFLSFSFVGLALLAQALPIDGTFLLITAVVLAFDLAVGLMTYGRIVGTSYEDYLAVRGMARIRHGYTEIAPVVLPYLTDTIHDDLAGVMVTYGSPPTKGVGVIVYQLTTSAGMTGLIIAMLGGVLGFVVALVVGWSTSLAFIAAAVAGLLLFVLLVAITARFYLRVQSRLSVSFPTPEG